MQFKNWDDKWHKWFAWYPVDYQSDYGEFSTVWLEDIYYKYNENRAALGISPWVYATKEAMIKFGHKFPAEEKYNEFGRFERNGKSNDEGGRPAQRTRRL